MTGDATQSKTPKEIFREKPFVSSRYSFASSIDTLRVYTSVYSASVVTRTPSSSFRR